ncbi:hypothetical protein B0H13DRAFT_1884873 [Mycena leptocephala]|nr:hypothetical protein B0H13DRAFT_1884873 [Mycena leptocephala]
MPMLLDGLQALTASFSASPRSVLSARFRNLWPSNARTTSLLVTTLVGGHHAISFPLAFQTVEHATFDVVLRLDWAAFLRDSLLSLGYRLDSTFDAWHFVSDPAHPLSSNRCRPHSSVSAGHAQLPASGAVMASGSAAGHGNNFPSTLKYPRSYKFSVSHIHGSMPVDVNLYNSEYNSEPLPGCPSFEPHSRWIPSLPRNERGTLPPVTSPLRAAPNAHPTSVSHLKKSTF